MIAFITEHKDHRVGDGLRLQLRAQGPGSFGRGREVLPCTDDVRRRVPLPVVHLKFLQGSLQTVGQLSQCLRQQMAHAFEVAQHVVDHGGRHGITEGEVVDGPDRLVSHLWPARLHLISLRIGPLGQPASAVDRLFDACAHARVSSRGPGSIMPDPADAGRAARSLVQQSDLSH